MAQAESDDRAVRQVSDVTDGKTKIPDALIPVLRARHSQGETLRALADELGVWPTAIHYAIRCRGGDAK